MDARRFDAIAKTLIGETTRRRAMGGLLSGFIGASGVCGSDGLCTAV